LSFSQSIIQQGAFFQLGIIAPGVVCQCAGRLAAIGAQAVEFVSNPGRASDRQGSMTFAWSHATKMTDLRQGAIEKESLSGIGVCLTTQGSNPLGARTKDVTAGRLKFA
jgi:hypothetical protein